MQRIILLQKKFKNSSNKILKIFIFKIILNKNGNHNNNNCDCSSKFKKLYQDANNRNQVIENIVKTLRDYKSQGCARDKNAHKIGYNCKYQRFQKILNRLKKSHKNFSTNHSKLTNPCNNYKNHVNNLVLNVLVKVLKNHANDLNYVKVLKNHANDLNYVKVLKNHANDLNHVKVLKNHANDLKNHPET